MSNATKKIADAQAPKRRPQGLTDWVAVRLAYVHSTKSMAQIAVDFGINPHGIEKRSEKEGWRDMRRRAAESIGEAVAARIEAERTEELMKVNEMHLRVARALLSQASANINAAQLGAEPMVPARIAQLAGAIEKTLRTARLALGATTENTGVSNPSGGPVGMADVPLGEYQDALKKFLSAI